MDPATRLKHYTQHIPRFMYLLVLLLAASSFGSLILKQFDTGRPDESQTKGHDTGPRAIQPRFPVKSMLNYHEIPVKFLTNGWARARERRGWPACRGHYSGKITLTWIGGTVLDLMALVLEEPRGQASRRTRAIIRIIDDSFPAYDRECLIERNGVKFRASCHASFCHRQKGQDRSIVVHPVERHWNARVACLSAIKKVFAGHYTRASHLRHVANARSCFVANELWIFSHQFPGKSKI